MSAWQEAAVRHWYRVNINRHNYLSNEVPEVRGVHGMDFNGSTIEEGRSSAQLAVMIREKEMRPFQDLPPLVLLRLPNALTIQRHRLIARVVKEEGGQTLAVPQRLLTTADINGASVDVLATQKHPPFLRAPHQLIKAQVRPMFSERRRRDSYFLSGYDLNEPGLSYFFCELPPGVEVSTIQEAYEALKPESVKLAEARGLRVERQGDLFFIPMERKFQPRPDPNTNGTVRHFIHGTNHASKYHARHEGLSYVAGTIEHRPAGRRKDHQPLRLGHRRWWLVVKNTVPIVR